MSEAEARSEGYRWRTPEARNYSITKKAEDLPDHIKDVPDSILSEIIQCQHIVLQSACHEQCTQAFNIQPGELEFYRRMNLPLPRLCPNCRHYELIKKRTPYKLWHRKCDCNRVKSDTVNGTWGYKNTANHLHGEKTCLNKFETSYAPERPEIIYCEECYINEVI